MGQKKCENYEECNNMCDEKYKYCLSCMNKYKKENPSGTSGNSDDVVKALNEIRDIMEKQNWNFGMLVATLRKDKKLVKKLTENEK